MTSTWTASPSSWLPECSCPSPAWPPFWAAVWSGARRALSYFPSSVRGGGGISVHLGRHRPQRLSQGPPGNSAPLQRRRGGSLSKDISRRHCCRSGRHSGCDGCSGGAVPVLAERGIWRSGRLHSLFPGNCRRGGRSGLPGIQHGKYQRAAAPLLKLASYAYRPNEAADRRCGFIMSAATIIFLVAGFVFNAWHPAWVVFPVGGLLCGMVGATGANEKRGIEV